MRRVFVPFLVAVFVWSSVGAWGKQSSDAPVTSDSQLQVVSNTVTRPLGCAVFFDALRAARQDVERDRQNVMPVSSLGDEITSNNENSSPGNLQQDLILLGQKEAEFQQCAFTNNRPAAIPAPPGVCSSEPLLNFQVRHHSEPEGEIPIWHLPGSPVFFYEAGMTIDADGAPNAYHPDNTGLDDLRNAGAPGNWEGLAKDLRRRTLRPGPGRSIPRLLRFGNRARRSVKARERSHALRGRVEDSFHRAAGRHGA